MPATLLDPPSDVALNLALSLISASVAPVLLLNGDLTILAASQSFRESFNVGAEDIPGARLADLGDGEWNSPQLWSLLKATAYGQASIQGYEMDLTTSLGIKTLLLNAQRLDNGVGRGIRLLLSIQDITEARAEALQKDDLIREKAVLVREIQHRVANSLQIIASVLMQGVRKVGSDESGSHLRDAHQRILSVAAVQRQLAGSELGDVELRGYFTDLCRSIGDSMIRDRNRVHLAATIDDSVAPSGRSVSLGLIVTELVINALKHAFPEDHEGQITVDYRAHDEGWTLMVCDDGVGMPKDPEAAKPGLGTGIVEALAKQLGATVERADAKPGLRVSIVCAPNSTDKS